MLHTLNRSPYYCDIKALLSIVVHGDDLLLLSEGVIAGIRNCPLLHIFLDCPITLHALEDDVVARGLSSYVSDAVIIINYDDFVILTEKQHQQIVW